LSLVFLNEFCLSPVLYIELLYRLLTEKFILQSINDRVIQYKEQETNKIHSKTRVTRQNT